MSGSTMMSKFLSNRIIDHAFRNTPFSPCPVYIALFGPPTTASGLEIATGSGWNLPDLIIKEISASCGYIRLSASGLDADPSVDGGGIGYGQNSMYSSFTTTSQWQAEANSQIDKAGINLWTTMNGSAANNYQLDFPKTSTSWVDATASGSWGWVTHLALMSGSTGTSGSIYFYGALSASTLVNNNEVFSISKRNLSVAIGRSAWGFGFSRYASSNTFCDFLNNSWLNYILNRYVFISPQNSIYIGAYITLPDRFEAGNKGIEVSAIDYVRLQWGGTKYWTKPYSGSTMSGGYMTFTVNAQTDWGKVEGIAIIAKYVNIPGDLILATYKFTHTKNIQTGDSFVIPTGYLKIFVD